MAIELVRKLLGVRNVREARQRRRALGVAVVAALLTSATTLAADLDPLRSRRSALSAQVDARAQTHADRAARVETLRSQGAEGDALRDALARAVEAEARLADAETQLRSATESLDEAIRAEIEALDAQTRALVPALGTGSLADRKTAAHRLAELRRQRSSLLTELRALVRAPQPRADAAWLSPELSAHPDDGPEELREKADFLDDAGDKLRAKRAALVALLERSEQTRRLRRASAALAEQSRLFEEETRPGRILRGGGGSPTGADAVEAPNVGDGTAPSTPGRGTNLENSPTDGYAGTDNPTPALQAVGTVPQRDLGTLLELEPGLALEAESPEAIRAWLERLAQAERRLRDSATELRRRAATAAP